MTQAPQATAPMGSVPSFRSLGPTIESCLLKFTPLRHQAHAARMRLEPVAVEVGDARDAGNVHEDVEVGEQGLHDVTHAVLAHDRQAPDPQAADEDEAGAERERLDDVRGAAHPRVEHDVDLVADGCRDEIE
nr:hypothetical protein CFP56_16516 [Quercus suber]POF04905.1 hypothetical protein CFP56_73866 [Quercus suber]